MDCSPSQVKEEMWKIRPGHMDFYSYDNNILKNIEHGLEGIYTN